MTHLAAGASFALAVDVEVRATLGSEFWPAADVVTDQVFHHRATPGKAGQAGRQVANGADVLLELRSDRAFNRPVAAVVNARRDLVDERPPVAGEELDRE